MPEQPFPESSHPDPSAPAEPPAGALRPASADIDIADPPSHHEHSHIGPIRKSAVLAAVGIVFGDIGTSPLYALQECFSPEHGIPAHRDNILGVVSLVLWSVTMVVTVKYLGVLMRADNRGEGGVMALLALVPDRFRNVGVGKIGLATWLAVAGAALLFGDGIITPAISVLSALEGLNIATPSIGFLILPLTVVILIGLFAIQRFGTARIGSLFGPIMALWFVVIGGLGIVNALHNPDIFAAISPLYGLRLLYNHGSQGIHVLGGVVLAITGGEALYADMGHFGRKPIQAAWFWLVYPALVLTYLGQGAVLLVDASAVVQPFYSQVSSRTAVLFLVILATPATIIASQALISSVFSLTHQAMLLGLFPRLHIKHTSADAEGQIFVPAMNLGLAVACITLVLVFQKSSNLASAYGLAVSGTMLITSLIFFGVMRYTWHKSMALSLGVLLVFLSFDLPFLIANALKFLDGGYLPVLAAGVFMLVMISWQVGRSFLAAYGRTKSQTSERFFADLHRDGIHRRAGTAVLMASGSQGIPLVLTEMVRRFGSCQQQVLLTTVRILNRPRVPEHDRIRIIDLGSGFYRVVLNFGFMESPDVPPQMATVLTQIGAKTPTEELMYVMGRDVVLATPRGEMNRVLEWVFALTLRNTPSAIDFFAIPSEQVVEIGSRVEL